MAISTYSELQTAVENRLSRDDISTDRIKEFIAAAEIRIADDCKFRAMENSLAETLSSGTQTISYPVASIGLKGTLWYLDSSGNYNAIEHKGSLADCISEYTDPTATGSPEIFCITGDTIKIYPVADDDYDIKGEYYTRLTLSDSAPTNWLLTYYPDLLLYGALIEAALFEEDDGRVYQASYLEELSRLRRYEHNLRSPSRSRKFRQVSL